MSSNYHLKQLYKKVLSKDNLLKLFGENLENYSAPFLLYVNEDYLNSNKKIMFIGKETNKWWGRLNDFVNMDNSIEILQQRYNVEIYGGVVQSKDGKYIKYKREPDWNNGFFVEYKKIRKHLLGDKTGSLLWSNILKLDNAKSKSYSRNTIKDPKVVNISKEIFRKEIEILKPDYMIFATSYTYDKLIKEFFHNEIRNSEVIEPKSLWKFKLGNTVCYRTWHPSTIRYKANKNKLEYYKDIIEDIKESLK